MSQIIYSCNQGLVTQGIIQVGEPVTYVKIFLDDPMNLIGFRTSLRAHTDLVDGSMVEYFEIGYFMEMIYEGLPKAFEILYTPEEHITLDSYDISILKSQREDLVSRTLVDNLINSAKKLIDVVEDVEEINFKESSKFVYEKLAYNNKNAYLCLRNILISLEVLKNNSYELNTSKLGLLQGVRDGAFSLKAIREGYDMYMKEYEELEKVSNIPLRPDSYRLNEILLDIRNVSIETLNVAKL